MKKTTTLSLLLAGILLSFTACEKGPQAGKLTGDVNLTIVTIDPYRILESRTHTAGKVYLCDISGYDHF